MKYQDFLKVHSAIQEKTAILLHKEQANISLTELFAISTMYYTIPGRSFERSMVIDQLTKMFEGWELSDADKHKFSTYATRFLSGLTSKGYISKEKDVNDRRKSIYHLTPKSINLIKKVENIIDK